MESEEISSTTSESLAPGSFQSTLSYQSKEILGEIVGATNLVAALREENNNEDRSSTPPTMGVSKIDGDHVNAFCNVYWSDELIHQTKTISKNNNPIWACDTGSLFTIPLRGDVTYYDLKIEVYDRVGRNENVLIGVISIPGETIQDGSICNEKRFQLELNKIGQDNSLESKESGRFYSATSVLYKNIKRLAPISMRWIENEDLSPANNDIDEEDSIYGGEKSLDGSERANIDDDYIFGKNGTIALRFRVASKDDIAFLRAIKIYNQGYRYACKKNAEALTGMKQILDGKRLANFVSERSTSYMDTFNCAFMNEFIDYRIFGKIDNAGVCRFRVKPGADPSRPAYETKFLTLEEIRTFCNKPSRNWVEAGSGNLGQVKLEILSCEGLPNKDYGEIFGNLTDPFVCIIYEDCLVETDVIADCINPMWMPWTQRAFVFNRMHELSSIYIGVFNHKYGPAQHDGCGRIAVDLSELKTKTVYTMKYELFSSPILTNRKSKGFITLRLQLTQGRTKDNLLSVVKPPVIHVNVRRRKTLAIARYTCYGKYREDVYNTRILRSYVDEFLEYVVSWSYILKRSVTSLIFWRGQIRVWKRDIPLHSFLAFVTTTYVIEHPSLIPAYTFFCAGWCMFVLICEQHRHPSPWYKGKSFSYHLRRFISSEFMTSQGESVDVNEGFKEMEAMEKEQQKIMEEDKILQAQISAVKRDLQQILAAVSSVVTIRTNEDVGGLNPLNKLLPVQLIMRDIIYYVRLVHMILSCKDSQLSSILAILCCGIGFLLLILPMGKIILWLSRLLVWVFLGPWMKLADMACKRKLTNIDEVDEHVKKIMKEIQGREKKRWMNARILREEALKLKATRILRFGRFAVKVPSLNVTRFRDHPLPESTARPVNNDNKDINNEFTLRRVPGQRHYGVMIPQLINQKDMKQRKKMNSLKLKRLKAKNKNKRLEPKEILNYGNRSRKREANLKLNESKESIPFMIEPAKSMKVSLPTELQMVEGFELIATTSGSSIATIYGDNEYESHNVSISSSEERDQTCLRKSEKNNEDMRERNQKDDVSNREFENSMQGESEVVDSTKIDLLTSYKDVEIQIERVLSDITMS
mmetsp:Transcript_19961/g.22835  ORF Transcript_19961/g.22835 Transcript_19961/m.22835 type:complete len:1095 (+) Transcript_19961:84-3368(+)|eukprot:CAMPEP_0194161682 /NCGR_PEP_ID=MMETSP0152-20130528/79072_1 /TAXON_ID=1049557 /ORGANISM="Thalassiothrix antarctica, Strain L6-D1" /LENGTH=1094 /DNA_ID=CAMNT_0038871497 /DNA_START=48 /DNA_END=3332 /DNA_ORIENTATION=-